MSVRQLKESGILEMYVLNQLTEQESQLVQYLRIIDKQIKQEILEIETALEAYAVLNQVALDPILESQIMANIDYLVRIDNIEESDEDHI